MNRPLTKEEQEEAQAIMVAAIFEKPAAFANQAVIVKTGPLFRVAFIEQGPMGPTHVAAVLLPDLKQLRDAIDAALKPAAIMKAPASLDLSKLDLSKLGNDA